MHEYASSLGLPELEEEASFFAYLDIAPAFARWKGISERAARDTWERDPGRVHGALAEDGSFGVFVNVAFWIEQNVAVEVTTRILAHEMSHFYQNAALARNCHLVKKSRSWCKTG